MTSVQSEGSDSTGPSQEGAVLGATQYDNCKACPFGGLPSPSRADPFNLHWHLKVDYEAVKESAERGLCQACAGMVKLFTAQKAEPRSLFYSNFDDLYGMTAGMFFRGRTRKCEFFLKNKSPAEEGSTNFDLHSRFYQKSSGSPLPIPRMPVPSGDTSSKAAFDTLKHWISQCEADHEQCKAAAYNRLPRRVLEIMSSKPLRIRLVENCMRHEKYACLSHRWGEQTKRNCLKKRNLDLYKNKVPEDKLYPLVRDAIEATSRLGLRFIWIDCYCIVQDDIEDWETEAANMASIYENAFFTISATFANRGRSMFSTIERKFEAFQVTEIEGEPVYVRMRLRHPVNVNVSGDDEYFDGPLLTRAWVFQERLLSRRFIHFTSSEIFWECRESTWCECGSRNEKWQFWRRQTPRTIGGQDWKLIAQQYNETQLTLEKDRLPALAGVAQRYSELHGGWTYLAGLWKEQLLSDLAWYKDSGCDEERPRKQVAPTWSWASLPRGGEITTASLRGPMPLVGCRIIPHDADRYSGVKRIEITVEGLLLDLEVYKLCAGLMIGRHKEGFLQIRMDFKTDPDDDIKYRTVRNDSNCRLLLLIDDHPKSVYESVFGILLQKENGDVDAGADKFKRIGVIDNPGFEDFSVDPSGEYAGCRGGSLPTNGSVYSGDEKFQRIGFIDEIGFQDSFVDLSGEYAGYRGGELPPPAGDHSQGWMTIGWLLDRAKVGKVTLV